MKLSRRTQRMEDFSQTICENYCRRIGKRAYSLCGNYPPAPRDLYWTNIEHTTRKYCFAIIHVYIYIYIPRTRLVHLRKILVRKFIEHIYMKICINMPRQLWVYMNCLSGIKLYAAPLKAYVWRWCRWVLANLALYIYTIFSYYIFVGW